MASHDKYMDYYLRQAQTGGGMHYYVGGSNQRGGGFLGNLLSGLFRFVSPLLPSLGREALRAGSHVLSDVAAGSQPLNSMKRHASEAGQNFLNMAAEKLRGNGIKRRKMTAVLQSKRRLQTGRSDRKVSKHRDIFS